MAVAAALVVVVAFMSAALLVPGAASVPCRIVVLQRFGWCLFVLVTQLVFAAVVLVFVPALFAAEPPGDEAGAGDAGAVVVITFDVSTSSVCDCGCPASAPAVCQPVTPPITTTTAALAANAHLSRLSGSD